MQLKPTSLLDDYCSEYEQNNILSSRSTVSNYKPATKQQLRTMEGKLKLKTNYQKKSQFKFHTDKKNILNDKENELLSRKASLITDYSVYNQSNLKQIIKSGENITHKHTDQKFMFNEEDLGRQKSLTFQYLSANREEFDESNAKTQSLAMFRKNQQYQWKCNQLELCKDDHDHIDEKQHLMKKLDNYLQTKTSSNQEESNFHDLKIQLQERLLRVTEKEQLLLAEKDQFLKQQKENQVSYSSKTKQLQQKEEDLVLQKERLSLLEESVKQKEIFYDKQIHTLNITLLQIVTQDNNLKNLQQTMTDQITRLAQVETIFETKLLQARSQEEACELREQGIQLHEELFQTKILRDAKSQGLKLESIKKKEEEINKQALKIKQNLNLNKQEIFRTQEH